MSFIDHNPSWNKKRYRELSIKEYAVLKQRNTVCDWLDVIELKYLIDYHLLRALMNYCIKYSNIFGPKSVNMPKG